MGNRKYEMDAGNQAGSEYAYDNPVSCTLYNGSGVATISSGDFSVNEAPNSDEVKTDLSKERSSSVSKVEKGDIVDPTVVDDEDRKFGWLWFRPKWVQFINTPLGYCIMLCLISLVQGMTVFGFVFIGLSTVEKRFFLNSVQSGSIAAAYDFSSLIVAVIVSYMGERGHRPLLVGFGSMLFCAGSITWAIPHFVTPNYEYQEVDSDFCGLPNETTICTDDGGFLDDDDESLSKYYWFFLCAQLLHGFGGAPLYTLGVAYADENVTPRQFGIFMGFYQALIVAGPSLAYIIGGAFLSIYTDLNVDPDSITIDPSSPLWVGAWWIGFLMNGTLLFIFTLIYLGFPKALPGQEKLRAEKRVETQKGCEFTVKKGALNQLKALPRAIFLLCTNLPFMFLNGAAISAFFFIAGLSVFGPKYLESQLSMTPSEAGYAMGIIAVIGGVTGALLGGVVINRMDLKLPGMLKFATGLTVLSVLGSFVFFAVCPTVDFAGVTVEYETREAHIGPSELNATCNERCVCSPSYDPVCGTDGIMYYSACHAGCDVNKLENGEVEFKDCQCVHDPESESGFGTVQFGTCSTACPYVWVYFVAMSLVVMFDAAGGVCGWTATIRCVSHRQRAFAMGIQTLFYGLLGTVPGPLVLGWVLDNSCVLWEPSCDDGPTNCWLYDNEQSARGFLILSTSCNAISALCLCLACVTYKSPTKQTQRQSSMRQEIASQDELETNTNELSE